METLISKSTFYDAVSMIVPGFILIYFIMKLLHIDDSYSQHFDYGYYICIFVLSYILGLFIHHISRLLFDPFLRNNPQLINIAEMKFKKVKGIRRLKTKTTPREKREGIIHEYYINYYNVLNAASVPVMEAQVAFLRSMILVMLILLIMLLGGDLLRCDFSIGRFVIIEILALSAIVSFALMCYIQYKIYERIIEDSHYIDIVNGKIPSLDDDNNAETEQCENNEEKK